MNFNKNAALFLAMFCVACTEEESQPTYTVTEADAGSDATPDVDTGPWENGCDWCNGPGCEELDEPCQNVESGSRGVTCPNGVTLTSADHCFPTTDKWNRPVLCCCETGMCPGV